MKERPIVIVHDLNHAKSAFAAAEALGVAVTVRSAPAAAGYLGAGVFAAMIRDARAAHPRADVRIVLDCGDAPAYAIEALRQGIDCIRVSAGSEIRDKLADIAAQTGGSIDLDRGNALDLLDERDPLGACHKYLATSGDRRSAQ